MEDGAKPSERSPLPEGAHLRSPEELLPVWDRFRDGAVVKCVKDAGSLALAVNAAAGTYRFICTLCGNSSPWFESDAAGLRIRAGFGATLGDD